MFTLSHGEWRKFADVAVVKGDISAKRDKTVADQRRRAKEIALLVRRIHVPFEFLLEDGQLIRTIVFIETIDQWIVTFQRHAFQTVISRFEH